MKPKPLLKAAIPLLVGLGLTLPAHAGIPVIDGANLSNNMMTAFESVAQTLKQIEEYAQQVEQYKTQLDQYENMLQNTAAPAAYIWDEANATINKLMQAQDMLNYYTNQAGSLESYLSKFNDLSTYKNSACFSSTGCSAEDMASLEQQEELASESQKKANDSLFKSISQQQTNLANDARQLERLQSGAASADGQMKAIQFANQIASQQANQLLQIRGLLLAQQTAFAAQQQATLDRQAKASAAGNELRKGGYESSNATKGLIR